ncbi:MarR family transcriptional regulator [Nocardia sp. CDC159]|uniref:MarR family transcriptional regulator n=1 Tax=Nocardia pulmonis TaxID=2951408 RepID=A0A9X2IXS6_9NOCA|nr:MULTISPECIES: MarR family transcriptional regulator [Nocardia]MCM6774954.1 MarR family transcriptional regulator [Nocardia pulmonis]MCM6789885.1 MarR family transcriptional regulator [Nocardia sp. CDC159]
MRTTAESAVLAVLAPGGRLTAQQISNEAQLPPRSARRAIATLAARGLIVATPSSRWLLSRRGHALCASRTGRCGQ